MKKVLITSLLVSIFGGTLYAGHISASAAIGIHHKKHHTQAKKHHRRAHHAAHQWHKQAHQTAHSWHESAHNTAHDMMEGFTGGAGHHGGGSVSVGGGMTGGFSF